ncbi:MAG TPA: hypothetical protein VFZ16_17305 [Hyphomicrobiaceae bacterium]|nr:hypothetical protein [Hyphomicrobiaceae bacterium]
MRLAAIAGCSVAAAAAIMPISAPGALAQDAAGTLAIRIPPSITAKAATDAILPIQVGPPGAIPPRSFVSIRGLPPAIGLQEAHAVGPGWWAIPLSALPALSATVPAGVSGQSKIVVSLIATDGRLLAQARSLLVIGPGQGAAAATPAMPDAGAEEKRARAERLLARGEAYLANGNIMGAREFFGRAAEGGLAAGALRLAATYDPVVLTQMKVQGVAPDLTLARKWYARARELGSTEATEPLTRLGAE